MMFLKYFYTCFQEALQKLDIQNFDIEFEIPRDLEYGDFSTNLAMKLAKPLKKSPKVIAKDILDLIDYDDTVIHKIEIAGPGFINIYLSKHIYSKILKELSVKGDRLGRLNIGNNLKVNVEYVSCNPTGLLHLGHGRNASLGDAIANLYQWLGYDVTREYYFNNAGKQMDNLAESIYARYMQKISNENYKFPEDGYQGEYIKDIADELIKEKNDSLKSGTNENLEFIKRFGERWCFDKITYTLKRMGIKQDVYFNETSLYENGKVNEVISYFKEKNLAYEKDGAIWLRLSKMGLDDDRVIVKSTGEPTYRLPDIAYHKDKYERGYDFIIDVFGSDHIATVPDVQAALKYLGCELSKMKVVIHQFITLTENGEQVKMSKRTGRNYTLDDLLDEVGVDVAKFFFIMRSANTHLEFDLNLAKEQSDKNPVFYLQYAYARICSIFIKAKDSDIEISQEPKLELLEHNSEIVLIKNIARFEDIILKSAEKFEPQILCDYLRSVAADFHTFYHECRVMGVEEELMQARFKLAEITKNVLKNGLTILGISAPEKM